MEIGAEVSELSIPLFVYMCFRVQRFVVFKEGLKALSKICNC